MNTDLWTNDKDQFLDNVIAYHKNGKEIKYTYCPENDRDVFNSTFKNHVGSQYYVKRDGVKYYFKLEVVDYSSVRDCDTRYSYIPISIKEKLYSLEEVRHIASQAFFAGFGNKSLTAEKGLSVHNEWLQENLPLE